MRKYLLIITCVVLYFKGKSQDTITLKTNERIAAKIIEVGIDEVKYKKWSYQEGATFILPKSDISTIKYKDGSIDLIGIRTENKNHKLFGHNIISWNPYEFAIGGNTLLSYEHIYKRGYLSFRIPLEYPLYAKNNSRYSAAFEFKMYPASAQGKVKGYIGNSIYGEGYYHDSDTHLYIIRALMMNGGISIQPSKLFNITIGGAIGYGGGDIGNSENRTRYHYQSFIAYKVDITVGLRF